MNRKIIKSSLWVILCVLGLLWLRTFIALSSWMNYERGLFYYLKYDGLTILAVLVFYAIFIAGLGRVQKLYRNRVNKCRAFFIICVLLAALCYGLNRILPRYQMRYVLLAFLCMLILPMGLTLCAQAFYQNGWSFVVLLWILILVAVPMELELMFLKGTGMAVMPLVTVANGAAFFVVLYVYAFRPKGYRWQWAMLIGLLFTAAWTAFCLAVTGTFASYYQSEWLMWNSQIDLIRTMWKNAANFGMSKSLETSQVYDYLNTSGGFVAQILFYAGRIPAGLFLAALLGFLKCLWSMLAPKHFGKFQYQAVYLSSFVWLALRIIAGFLAGAGLIQPVISLPFEMSGTSILDSTAAALMLFGAIRSCKVDLAGSFVPAKVTDFVEEREYYDVQKEADASKPWVDLLQEDGEQKQSKKLLPEDAVLVVRSGATEVRCKAVNFHFVDHEFGIFAPEGEDEHRVFVLRHVTVNYWKAIRSERMERRLLTAYFNHEIHERLGEEYEELKENS